MATPSRIAQYDHFIPLGIDRLLEALADSGLDEEQRETALILRRLLGEEFRQRLDRLRERYLPFNPDRELLLDDAQPTADADAVMDDIDRLLRQGNYQPLNREQITEALERSSPYGLVIEIDLDRYRRVTLYYRGKSSEQVTVRDWRYLYLKKRSVSLLRYSRLCLVLQYRDRAERPGIHIKLFKDILRADLEMLFPDCRLRMKPFDKIKLALTGGGGTAGGLMATLGKISAAVSPWTIAVALGGFAALLWRQVSKVFVQRTRYAATLARNLYFHNLDNNAGALAYLNELALDEEIKELLMSWALLQIHGPMNLERLDDACEAWFAERYGIGIDFDIEDAVHKLQQQGLLQQDGEMLSARPVAEVLPILKQRWNRIIDPRSDD